ncbi:MAG TPA: DUF1254 domain-containing protein [Candidatus Methylacidiphilales bacterium]
MKTFLPRLLLVLLAGWAGYYLTIVSAPYVVFYAFEHKLLGKIPDNTLFHAPLPTAAAKNGTMPNPDFLYSILKYNLADGPIHLTGTVPHNTYWSFSTYQANSSNFYVINDEQIPDDHFDFVIAKEGQSLEAYHLPANVHVIYSPSTTGVGLFRLLASTKINSSDLEALRQQTHVERLKN